MAADPPRPNILVIMCDDLGYADVGFNGAKDIQTPSLDRLARNGTVFSSAYVAHPFCGPSRMGMMAGRYPHKFGAPYNLPNSGVAIEGAKHQGIPQSETLISTVLQDAGYYTGVIGKWHLGVDPPFHPNNRGFDDFYGFLGGGHDYFPEKYMATYERQKNAGKTLLNDYILPLEHNGKQVTETQYMTDALSRESVRFVNEAAQKDQPFFCFSPSTRRIHRCKPSKRIYRSTPVLRTKSGEPTLPWCMQSTAVWGTLSKPSKRPTN
ncbi:N-acetylgalactosamine-4-sulfatase [Rhodopirellula maiorica SM1]|uniref:N-acetylgalactosamine-4-sulfatase n=1 Tax=Rhodopirellula maiorica SM1 TaxID=1265738 RepID=M5RQ85_9BACT|nr:N-acetylgalactosamine-4-sulfatase [Rhodopirellula maiorica SM1]